MAKLKGGTRVFGGLTVDSALTVADVTISGNLVIQGTTTTVDSTSTRIEDPLIELGGGAAGAALSVNDGKERGLLMHYYDGVAKDAYMGWNTTGSEFAFAKQVVVSDNDVTTVTAYGNVHGDHFIGSGAALTSLTGAEVTGTVALANMAAYAGNVTNASQPNITSLGNLTTLFVGNATSNISLTGGVLTTTGNANVGGNINVIGNAKIGNLIVDGTISGTFSGSTSAPGANTQIVFNDDGTSNATSGLTFDKVTNALVSTGNVSGGNLTTAGVVSATGNVSGGNLTTAGVVAATGNVSGGNLTTAGAVDATGTITGGNLSTAGTVAATGNVSGGNLTTAGVVSAATLSASGTATVGNLSTVGTVTATGTITGGDLTTGGNIDGTGAGSTANVSYLTVRTTANITSTATVGNLSTAGTVIATGNITGGNLTTTGKATVGVLNVTGTITGDLIPTTNFGGNIGNATLAWKDLWLSGTTINLGTQSISSNAEGTTLSNVTTMATLVVSGTANVGNLTTAGTIVGANVTANNVAATQIVFADSAKKLVSDAALTFASGTLTTTNVVATDITGTLLTASQTNITAVGTLGGLTVTNTITGSVSGSAATVRDAAQTAITSVGVLTGLVSSGTIQANTSVVTDSLTALGTNVTVTAGGENANVVLAPTGTGTVDVSSKRITSVAAPSAATDAATKGYVDANSQGLDVKQSVRAGTTANIALDGTVTTVDGVALANGDRVLVKAQTTASQNGIYVVGAEAWTRSIDTDATGKITGGTFTFVEEGSTQADTGWVVSTNGTIAVGTDAIAFTQFSGAGQYSAGSGLTLVGTEFSANVDGSTIDISGGAIHVKDGLTLVTPNIGVATGTSLNLGAGVITANGSGLTAINGANVSEVALATNVTAGAQANITSVGTLLNLTVTGNITASANVNVTTNVTAAAFKSDSYQYANGSPIDFQTAAGTDYQIQFHAQGAENLAASANLTFDGNALVITGTANVSGLLTAGNIVDSSLTSGQVTFAGASKELTGSTDLTFVSGTLTTVTANVTTLNAGNIVDSSLTSGQITFAGAGKELTGSANLEFDTTAKLLSTDNVTLTGYIAANAATVRDLTSGRVVLAGTDGLLEDSSVLTFDTGTSTLTTTNVTATSAITAATFTGSGAALTALNGANVTGQVGNALVAGTVYGAAQTAITSVGTLTALTVSGATNLGAVGNVTVTGGTGGQYLQTNGSGVLSWASVDSSQVANGNSSVSIPTANGNVIVAAAGATRLTVTGVGANVTGTLDVSGNISGNNISAATGITATGNTDSTSSITGTVVVTGGIAAQGNIYTGHSVGFANNNGGTASAAYIQFNATANSLDFIFD